jgi:iron(III) transport system substrate-binding protein
MFVKLIITMFIVVNAAYAQTKLLVYSALEPDQLLEIKTVFEGKYPDISILWHRAPIGNIAAKIIAEKDNPKADVVYGLGLTSITDLNNRNLLYKFIPAESTNLEKIFKSDDGSWHGFDAFLSAICFNTVEGKKQNIQKPTSINDLLKPEFKGKITMPNPVSSGTGFMIIAGIIEKLGDSAGWDYIEKLDKNIAHYTPGGSAPCINAATGEFPIGWSVDMRAAKLISEGAPIEFIVPTEGIFWDMEVAAIIAGTKNEVAAKTLINWIYSKEAMKLYGKYYAILGRADVETNTKFYPGGNKISEKMIKLDLNKISANKDIIIKKWTLINEKSKK